MSNATLPKIHGWVDWDGDGYINRGPPSDPRNIALNPLTLMGAGRIYISGGGGVPTDIYPKYAPTQNDGIFSYSNTSTRPMLKLGFNRGTIGDYVAIFTPPATGNYTLQLAVKRRSGVSGGYNIKLYNVYNSPADQVNIVSSTYLLSMSTSQTYHPVINFTVNSITNMQIGVEFTFAGGFDCGVVVQGLMITPGTTSNIYAFNVGTDISKYDDISADILSANWQLGLTGTFDNVPSEGTAQLSLRNTTYKYSPENSASPFYRVNVGTDINYPAGQYPYTFPYPAFAEGTVISIEIENDAGTPYEMWRGFIDTIKPGSVLSQPSVSLTAVQGWFKFDQVKINPLGITDTSLAPYVVNSDDNQLPLWSAGNIIAYLLANYATMSKVPNVSAVNKTTGDNRTVYDVIAPSVGNTIDFRNDGNTYRSVVQTWSSDTTLAEAIKDLMTVDQSIFFMLRDGTGWYRFRDAFHTNDPFYFLVGTEFVVDDLLSNSDDYKIAQTEVNSVKVDYYPSSIVTGQLWYSKSPLVIGPKTTKTFTAKIEYPEGSKINVQTVNAFNAAVSPSTAVAKTSLGVTYARQAYSIRINNRGTEVDLIITNATTNTYYISVVLNGTYYVTAGSATVYKQIPTSFGPLGTREQSYSSKLITDVDQAEALASHILSMIGGRYATYPSITVSSRDATWLQNILNMSVGYRIKFRGTAYTGGIYHRHLIIGESASWTPGILTMTYTLRPTDQYAFLNTDTTYYKLGGVVY